MNTVLLRDILDFIDQAPFDFKNGNTDSTGTIDEGQVRGMEWLTELRSRIIKELEGDEPDKLFLVEIMQEKLQQLQSETLLDLAKGLYDLLDTQKAVSSPVKDCIPSGDYAPSKDSIRTYVLALFVELGEFLQTLDWKPWKEKPIIDRDRVIDEFADILAFQGIIVYYLSLYGISPLDLAEGYRLKSIVNIERFLGKHGKEYQQLKIV